MAQAVTRCPFHEAGLPHGLIEDLLENGHIHMMTSFLIGLGASPAILLREHPLPAPVQRRLGILPIERIKHPHSAPPSDQVHFVDRLHFSEMIMKGLLDRFRKHRRPVPGPLAVSDYDFTTLEIDILHSQAQAFCQAKARPIHQGGISHLLPTKLPSVAVVRTGVLDVADEAMAAAVHEPATAVELWTSVAHFGSIPPSAPIFSHHPSVNPLPKEDVSPARM